MVNSVLLVGVGFVVGFIVGVNWDSIIEQVKYKKGKDIDSKGV